MSETTAVTSSAASGTAQTAPAVEPKKVSAPSGKVNPVSKGSGSTGEKGSAVEGANSPSPAVHTRQSTGVSQTPVASRPVKPAFVVELSNRTSGDAGQPAAQATTGSRDPAFGMLSGQEQDETSTKAGPPIGFESKEQDAEAKGLPYRQTADQSAGRYVFMPHPQGHRSVEVDGQTFDMTPVPGNPQATIDKMNSVRRTALMKGVTNSEEYLVAINATTTALKARRDLQDAQRMNAAERFQLLSDQAGKDEEEVEDTTAKAPVPIQTFPVPSTYAMPNANGGQTYTPRFSAEPKNSFNSDATDPSHSITDPAGSGRSNQYRNISRAFGPEETDEPIVTVEA